MKKPFIQLYCADHLSDLNLRSCHPIARALWVDLMCLMAQGIPYGHLRIEPGHPASHTPGHTPKPKPRTSPQGQPQGQPQGIPQGSPQGHPLDKPNGHPPADGPTMPRSDLPPNGSIEALCHVQVGLPPDLVAWCIEELEEKNVFSRRPDGIIYSRRMVADHERYLRLVEKGRAAQQKQAREREKAARQRAPHATPTLTRPGPHTTPPQTPPTPPFPQGQPQGQPQGLPQGSPPASPQGQPSVKPQGQPPPYNHNQIYQKNLPPSPPSASGGGTRRLRPQRPPRQNPRDLAAAILAQKAKR